ncbi:hypothetical protein [Hoeflea olei]|nr:hypothetical protein [Hoeflea olei]
MATILTFDRARCRVPMQSRSKAGTTTAQILFFTGIRREPLKLSYAPHPERADAPVRRDPDGHPPRHPEPMFDDGVPQKPGRAKRRNAKSR